MSVREGLRIARQVQAALFVAIALQHLALLIAPRRQPHCAARLLSYVDAQFKALGYERETIEKRGYDMLMSALRDHLSEGDRKAGGRGRRLVRRSGG